MARVPSGQIPEPRDDDNDDDGSMPRKRNQLDPVPNVTVLGYMDGNIALRLGWRTGMRVVSNSRFKFMREELEMNIIDDPDEYLF
jgi:hypothetical protein